MKIIMVSLFCFAMTGISYADDSIEILNNKLDALTMEVQSLKEGTQTAHNRFSFGGYGEFTYTNKRTKKQDGTIASHSKNPQLDAQRFIIYTGYQFTDKWKLTAEIEIEHVNQIFLEQAYLENSFSKYFNFQVGVMLIPVGITNIFHEPTAFHSVERPGTDNKILPTTWREMGMGFSGTVEKLSYKFYLFNSLTAGPNPTKNGFSASGVRDGRKKASQAEARDLSYVGRIDYSLLPTVDLGVSYYLGKADGVLVDVKHNIWDIHLMGEISGISIKALYTETHIDNALGLNNETGESVASKMRGYYIDLGYNLLHGRSDSALIPFIMYEAYNTQDEMPVGYVKDASKNIRNLTYGINYKPITNIVFKVDYMRSKNQAKSGYDTWSLGAGWNF